MTTPQDTIWDIEPHTVAKHEILRRYMGAWFPILGTHNRRIVYIDGFCGPGRYKGGEDGSPIIALREALKHSQRLRNNEVIFLFMDERTDRIAHLNYELSRFAIPGNFVVRSIAGQFEHGLRKLLDDLDTANLRLAPTFAFVDPFGFKGVPFDLVQRLLANEKTEVLVNVMVEAINRFLEHPDGQTRQHIVELFGTPQVLQVARKPRDRVTGLRLLYQRQLSQHARFVRYFEMRSRHGRTMYYLFFASNHPLGHAKMKEAFWRVDPASGFRFSDATNPDQLILLDADETPKLAATLMQRFVRQRVAVGQLRRHVEDETAFVAAHMRAALRLLEDGDAIAVGAYKLDGTRRRARTYPDDAVVEFK